MQIDGASLRTVEALAPEPGRLSILQEAFRRHHALQCGFCTPGILMSLDSYLRAHPDADTIMFPSPHWPVLDAIEPLEREFGVKVMGALQAIVWEALRRTGIKDRIEGFGSLLRDC